MSSPFDLTDSLERIPVKIFPEPAEASLHVAGIIAALIRSKAAKG